MRNLFWCLSALGALGLSLSAGVAQERASSSRLGQLYQNVNPASRLSFLSRKPAQEEAEKDQTPQDKTPSPGDGILRYQRTRSSEQASAKQQAIRDQAAAAQRSRVQRSATGLKNYHKELFGTAAPPVGQSQSGSTRQLSAAPKPGSTTAKTGTTASTAQRPQYRDSRVRQASASQPAAAEASPIRQAGGFPATGSKGGIGQADFTRQGSKPETIRQTSGTAGAPRLPADTNVPLLKPEAPAPRAGGGVLKVGGPLAEAPAAPLKTRRGPAGGFVNFTQDSPHIVTHWTKQSDINVGQPCELLLHVNNSGKAAASQVQIEVYLPRTVRITAASPEPTAAQESVIWEFPTLDAGEERQILITMIPSIRGEITANANVRYSTAATTLLAVEEPMLKLAVAGSKEAMIGEPAPQVVTISNPGTGIAHNVTLEVTIPEGLEHPKGNRLKMDLGSLNPGESRSVRLSLTAQAGGENEIIVEARSGSELRENATTKVNVLAPSLKLAVNGPALRYVGRDARYSLTLSNDGQAVTNNVRALYVVPKGFDFVFASRGGKYDERNRTVTWFIGSVRPEEKVDLSLKLKPVTLGDFAHIARAISEHGAVAEATADTRIEGTASLVLEVLDLDDPVETGRETAYEVRVRNEGSKEAQNVGMSFELPPGVKLINAKGPSQHIAESGLVVFRALPALEAGKTAIFQIHVKGSEEGNHRVRARLTSDSIQEPLTVEELTRFYAD